MPNKNVEIISDNNYSITGRRRPVKKKRTVFGTILALLISLLLALFVRYYIEFSAYQTAPLPPELVGYDMTESAELV